MVEAPATLPVLVFLAVVLLAVGLVLVSSLADDPLFRAVGVGVSDHCQLSLIKLQVDPSGASS